MARLSRRSVEIAGGGLAGLSLAAGLCRRGVPVVVYEAGRYPRHRVCGEFISGVREETLERLGILDLFADARRHWTVGWRQGGCLIHRDRLPEAAWGISRYVLDQRLAERVREWGGEVREGQRIERVGREGLVWAAGRRRRAGSWIGLKMHVSDIEMTEDLEMESSPRGYVGWCGIEGGQLNLCGLFRLNKGWRAQGAELLGRYLEGCGLKGSFERWREARWDEASFQAVAGFELGVQEVSEGELVIGDADRMIPPFTGHGMSMAFQSAEVALDALVKWSEGRMAWNEVLQRVEDGLQRRFRRRMAAAQCMHPVLLSGVGSQVLGWMGAAGLLPFSSLLSFVRE